MNKKKDFNILLFALVASNLLLLVVGWIFLKRAGTLDNGKIDPSDYIAVAAILVSLIIGLVAVIYSSKSLRFAQKAEEGQLYIKMMERYTSKEMVNALKTLGEFKSDNEANLDEAIRKWSTDLNDGHDYALKIEGARHTIKYFYRDLMQLYQAKYFNKELTKRILNPGGRQLFKSLVLPMERYRNTYRFKDEYAPFDVFFEELKNEQELETGERKVKTICLIPARLDSTRFHEKLMQPLGGKTVIRYTYDSVIAMGLFDEVAVVTNNGRIKNEIADSGGKVIFIDKEYESGTDRIADALLETDADIIVNIQGDEPFISPRPVQELINLMKSHTNDIMVTSMMCLMDNRAHIESSDYVKVVCDKQGNALYFSRSIIPFEKKPNLQPDYFEHIGVYGFTRKALKIFTKLEPTKAEKIESVECLRFLENSIPIRMIISGPVLEIDTEEDLRRAESILANTPPTHK